MGKINCLHGLRGLAALIVVINHFVVGFYPALYSGNINEVHITNGIEVIISKSPLNLIYQGNLSVCIFFVLSGFVLSYNFFKHVNHEIIVDGAVRRYFRLFLPVMFSMIIVYILMRLSLFFNIKAAKVTYSSWWLGKFWSFKESIFDVLKQGLVQVFFRYSSKYNTVLWTMTYEFYGSLLVYAIISIIGNIRNRYVFYMVATVLLLKTYYLAFVIGVILSDISVNTSVFKNINNKLITTIFLILGLFLGSYPSGISVDDTIYSFMKISFLDPVRFYHIIGAFLIMINVLCSKRIANILSSRIFLFLGDISFSMYLIHTIIIGTLSSYMILMLTKFFSYNISFIITFITSIVLIIYLSIIMYKHVDLKGIEYSKHIYKKFFKNEHEG